MPDATWYEAMGKAMAKREKCINAINRWKSDLMEVEAEIEALRLQDNDSQQPVPNSVTAPSGNAAVPDADELYSSIQ